MDGMILTGRRGFTLKKLRCEIPSGGHSRLLFLYAVATARVPGCSERFVEKETRHNSGQGDDLAQADISLY
jgi:hypothetical protein